MTKNKSTKLSRREREQQRQTRRIMLFGGLAFGAAAAAGIGVTFLPANFPSLEGQGNIESRLGEADLTDHVLRLTPDTGKGQVLVAGTTDCSFCRDFVQNGLDDVVAFAKKEGIGLIYAPTGSTKSSLGSSKLVSCFAGESDADPVKMLQKIYQIAPQLNTDEGLEKATKETGRELGLSQEAIAACLAESNMDVTARIQALGRAFPIRGTPIFFVESTQSPETINWFSGWPGASGLSRQILAARGA